MTGARLSDGLLQVFADSTAKATLLLALAWVAARTLRRSSAAVRHRIWALSLCGLIALPVASSLIPGWQLPLLPASARTVQATAPITPPTTRRAEAVGSPRIAAAPMPAQDMLAQGETPPSRAVPPDPIPPAHADRREAVPAKGIAPLEIRARWTTSGAWLAVWGPGFLAVMLPTLAGLAANEVRRWRAQPITTEDWSALVEAVCRQFSIRRVVELRRSEASLIPLTWGILRPVVLLPEDAHSWPEATRRLVLLHELAHVQRVDAGFQLAGRLAAALYWFHPFAWYGLHRLRLECEHACDDCVVQAGERPTDYARQLLDLVRSLRIPLFSMAVAMSRRSALEERMMALFDDTRSHMPLDRRTGMRLLASSIALILGLATVHPRPPAAAADEPAADAKPTADSSSKASGQITGRVVLDKEGSVVEGAEVLLLLPPPDGGEYYYVKYPLRRVPTDAKGEFSFDGLAPGRYRVWANLGKLTSRRKRADGPVVVLSESGEAPKPAELRLVAGVALRARVKDRATGKPIPGATVHIAWSDFPVDPTTDREGQALLQPLRAQLWSVEAWADGFARESQAINLENGADADVEFLLGPGGNLEGVVRDPSGKPLAKAGLSASLAGRFKQIVYVETDNEGRYRLENLPRDVDLQLSVSKTDYGRKNVPAKVTIAKMALDLTLEPRPDGGSIAGVVLDHMGRPIAGAELVNRGSSSRDVRETKTGPDGRFRLDNLYESPNLGKEVLVRAKGAAPKRVKVETGPADRPVETTITLDVGHRINGRVVDDRGNPLEGVRVYFAQGNRAFSDGGRGTTDKEGRFTFDALPPGSPFTFTKAGYSEIDDRQLPLDTDEVVTVTMVPAGVIAGKLLDAKTGRPIRAFNVRIQSSPRRQPGEPSSGLWSDLVDPGQNYQSGEGLFRLGNLVVGMPLQVTVSAHGYEKAVAERVVVARPDEAQVEEYRLNPLDPASLRTYRGRLLDAQGKPVVGAQLRLIAAQGRDASRRQVFPFNWQMIENGQLARQANVTRFLEAMSDNQGRFEFTQVPRRDEVELVWWGRGIAPGRIDHLELLDEKEKESIDVITPMPARIVGTFDRRAFAGAVRIRVAPITGFGLPDVELEMKPDQNEFGIGDLAPGEYWVSVMSPYERRGDLRGGMTSRPLVSERVTVRPGENRRVEFNK